MQESVMRQQQCDVLVIGGGPAGASMSTLLAEKGWHVVVLEKDHHPRFHIGESLLPLSIPFFERLGVLEDVERMGIRKYAAEFDSMYHQKMTAFQFGDALNKNYPYAFEVRRAEFDHMLLRNSAARGAEIHEGLRVTGVEFHGLDKGASVQAIDEAGHVQRWAARFVVDASGRDTLLARQFKIKEKNKKHDSAALFGHFEGAQRHDGRDEGNITIYWFDHGWFWFIPLKDGVTSVGAVCWPYYLKGRKNNLESFLWDTIRLCPGLHARLKDAKLVSPVTGTGNYAYQAQRMTGEGYIMIGDAFAFVDPVFSSGVHLALNSGIQGAEVVDTCLRHPERAAQTLRNYDKSVRRGLKVFTWFIYRITSPAMRDLMMAPGNLFRMQEAVTSVLAGDIFRPRGMRLPLWLFKGVYYLKSLHDFRRSYAAYKRRKHNISADSAPAEP